MSIEVDFIEQQIIMYLNTIRPPIEMRDKLDFNYTYDKVTFVINEIRQNYIDPSTKSTMPIIKGKFVKSKSIWKLYWADSNLKWIAYKPCPEVKTIQELFEVVSNDKNCCFFL